jgi:hypothetical protein
MGIKAFFFGKEKVIADKKLGLLKTRIKNTNPSISNVWASEVRLSGQLLETVIILEGNSEGPFKEQLDSAYKIVDSTNDISARILIDSKNMNLDTSRFIGDWIKEFYLSAITPIDLRENSFEVEFESTKPEDNRYVLFTWRNNVLSEIDIK